MNIKNTIKNIDKVEASKKVVRTATALSVGKAAQIALRNNIPTSENRVANFAVSVACYVGGAVISGYALTTLGDYSDKQIDELFAPFKALSEETDENSDVIEGTVQ